MTRPEAVRCESCCYWSPKDDKGIGWGECRRYPSSTGNTTANAHEWNKLPSDWCGEFRESWPGSAECPTCRQTQPLHQPHPCLVGYRTLSLVVATHESEEPGGEGG
jgi:hypothetical protein